jgi:hypothetical protein
MTIFLVFIGSLLIWVAAIDRHLLAPEKVALYRPSHRSEAPPEATRPAPTDQALGRVAFSTRFLLRKLGFSSRELGYQGSHRAEFAPRIARWNFSKQTGSRLGNRLFDYVLQYERSAGLNMNEFGRGWGGIFFCIRWNDFGA